MTTNNHATALAAAEANLAEVQADVQRLRAQLAGEEQPRKLATWEDGQAAARKRHPGRTRSEMAAGNGDAEGQALPLTGAAAGRAAARARAARRGFSGDAA